MEHKESPELTTVQNQLQLELKKLLKQGLYDSAQILGEFLVSSIHLNSYNSNSTEKAEGYILFADALSANQEFYRAIWYYRQAINIIGLNTMHGEHVKHVDRSNGLSQVAKVDNLTQSQESNHILNENVVPSRLSSSSLPNSNFDNEELAQPQLNSQIPNTTSENEECSQPKLNQQLHLAKTIISNKYNNDISNMESSPRMSSSIPSFQQKDFFIGNTLTSQNSNRTLYTTREEATMYASDLSKQVMGWDIYKGSYKQMSSQVTDLVISNKEPFNDGLQENLAPQTNGNLSEVLGSHSSIENTKSISKCDNILAKSEIRLKIALCHQNLGQYQSAVAELEQIEDSGRSTRILCLMSRLYRQLKQAKKAVQCYQECLRQCPSAVEAYLGLAEMNVPLHENIQDSYPDIYGENNAATSQYRMPKWMSDLVVGHWQLKEQNYASAKKHFESILKVNQGFRQNLHVLVSVAYCQYGMGRIDEALQTLRRCYNIDDRYVYGMDLFAIILQQKYETTGSKTYSQELSQLASQTIQQNSTRPEVYVVQAVYFRVINDIAAMELSIEKGSLIQPVNYWLLVVDGIAKLSFRLIEKAALCFRKATSTNGCNLDSQLLAYKGLVDCSILQGNTQEAISTAKQVMKQYPNNPKAQVLVGYAYLSEMHILQKSYHFFFETNPTKQKIELLEYAARAFQTACSLAPQMDESIVGGFILTKLFQHIITQPRASNVLRVHLDKNVNGKQNNLVDVGLKYIDEAIGMIRSYLEVNIHEEMVASIGILEAYRENYQLGVYFLNQAFGLQPDSQLARLGLEALSQVLAGKPKKCLLDVLSRHQIQRMKINEFEADMNQEDK